MRFTSLLAAAAIAATSLHAQVLEVDTSTREWQRFQQSQKGDWTAVWSPAAGTPSAIYGEGIRLQDAPIGSEALARGHSEATLRRYAALLGQGKTEFVESIAGKMNQTWVFVYDQKFQGLEILGGRADVRINDIGVLALFGATAFQIPAGFSVEPKVEPSVARLIAYRREGVTPTNSIVAKKSERLVIWADATRNSRSPIFLAWEVRVKGGDKYGRSYINAQNGKFIEYQSDIHDCGFPGCKYATVPKDGEEWGDVGEDEHELEAVPESEPGAVNVVGKVMGWVNTSIQPTAAPVNVPLRGVRVTITSGGSGSALTDANGDFSITHSGTAAVTVRATLSQARRAGSMAPHTGTPVSATATLTPGTSGTVQFLTSSPSELDLSQTTSYYWTDFINEWTRQPHIMNNNPTINGIDTVRIRPNQNSNCNATYGGNTTNYYTSGGGCPNTAYSTVVQHEWGHGLDDQFGGISRTDGLSEGYADCVAILQTGQPLLGPGFINGRPVRDARNTRTFPAGGGVHQQGEPWMGGAWDVRTNLIASLGAAAGARRAETIVIGAMIADPTDQRTALREIYIADDDDGNINNGTPNCNDIFAAYTTKRRIPSPIRSCSANPGTYTTYGAGCKGSGQLPSSCFGVNPNGGSHTGTSLPNEYAYPVQMTTAKVVTGFEMFTKTAGAAGTVTINVYRGTSAGPTGSPVTTGTLAATGTAGFRSTTFAAPVSTAANEVIWISQQISSTVFVPQLASGTAAPFTVKWRRTGTAWSNTGIVSRPSYKVNCAGGGQGGAIPALTVTGLPEIGRSVTFDLSNAAANANAVLFLGASRTTWVGTTLPLDLTFLGAAGCNLLASGESALAVSANARGRGSFPLAIPNNASLVDAKFFNQYIVLDAAANNLGLAFSNGGEAKVGKP